MLNWEIASTKLTCGHVCGILPWLVIAVGRPSVGSTIPRWVVLGCIKKLAEPARGEVGKSVLPWFIHFLFSGFCLGFPSWWILYTLKAEINHFLLTVFYLSNKSNLIEKLVLKMWSCCVGTDCICRRTLEVWRESPLISQSLIGCFVGTWKVMRATMPTIGGLAHEISEGCLRCL